MIQLSTIARLVFGVFPLVDRELAFWQKRAQECPSFVLRDQAISSMNRKRFHCQGGSVFAANFRTTRRDLVSLIVGIQTISDYLDNLCDRVPGCYRGDQPMEEETAFRQLHMAIIDAVSCNRKLTNYYAFYPFNDDGGYLESLVEHCRNLVVTLPGYEFVRNEVVRLLTLYSDLQVYKHLPHPVRETMLKDWFDKYAGQYPGIHWWEFAAAAGSTLGVFVLLSEAARSDLSSEEVDSILDAYFPWVCGFHILLDYLIDQKEDLSWRDLNFVSYYESRAAQLERLRFFFDRAVEKVSRLSFASFHCTVVKGLAAFYLSDAKALTPELKPITRALIQGCGFDTRMLHGACCILRRLGRI